MSGMYAACFALEGYCTIYKCHNVGVTIIATKTAYGIAGDQAYSSVMDCTNSGSVTGKDAYGISAGYGIGSYVENCTNYGNITATSGAAAGIASGGEDHTSNCYNYGAVHGVTFAAGIIDAGGYGEESWYDADCYNYGTVTVAQGGKIMTLDEAAK